MQLHSLQGQFSNYATVFPFCIIFRITHDRGKGTSPSGCPSSHADKEAGLCYADCRSGYTGIGQECVKFLANSAFVKLVHFTWIFSASERWRTHFWTALCPFRPSRLFFFLWNCEFIIIDPLPNHYSQVLSAGKTEGCLTVEEPVRFLRLAALRIDLIKTAACATSGVGLATNPSAAVCVRRVGVVSMGEEEGLCLSNTVRQADLTNRVDFAIQTVDRIIKG